jgi:hypothetical protein
MLFEQLAWRLANPSPSPSVVANHVPAKAGSNELHSLRETAQPLVTDKKGVLAMDERNGACAK